MHSVIELAWFYATKKNCIHLSSKTTNVFQLMKCALCKVIF